MIRLGLGAAFSELQHNAVTRVVKRAVVLVYDPIDSAEHRDD
jgi:hypothetical protein